MEHLQIAFEQALGAYPKAVAGSSGGGTGVGESGSSSSKAKGPIGNAKGGAKAKAKPKAQSGGKGGNKSTSSVAGTGGKEQEQLRKRLLQESATGERVNWLELLLSKQILEEERYLGLRDPEIDPKGEFEGCQFTAENRGKFKFVLLTSCERPDMDLLSRFLIMKLVTT